MSKRITAHCDDNLLRQVREFARAHGLNFSEAVRELLRLGLRQPPQERARRAAFTQALRVAKQALSEAARKL